MNILLIKRGMTNIANMMMWFQNLNDSGGKGVMSSIFADMVHAVQPIVKSSRASLSLDSSSESPRSSMWRPSLAQWHTGMKSSEIHSSVGSEQKMNDGSPNSRPPTMATPDSSSGLRKDKAPQDKRQLRQIRREVAGIQREADKQLGMPDPRLLPKVR